MTLHTVGDSHAVYPFSLTQGVVVHHLGPITMERLGHPGDTSLPRIESLSSGDVIAVSSGEIDCRHHIISRSQFLKKTREEFMRSLAERYVHKLLTYKASLPNEVIVSVISIPPPARQKNISHVSIGAAGTDEERSIFTRTLNQFLDDFTNDVGLMYLDVYGLYADIDGMLPIEISDVAKNKYIPNPKGIHIIDATKLTADLRMMGLVQ